jgi:UDP-glucose 4-epimerase
VTDGCVHTTDEIVHAICVALNRPPPRWHVPAPVAFGAATIVDGALRLISKDRSSLAERLQRYTEDVAVDGSKFQRELGFRPVYPLEEGWKQAISEFRRSG